MCITITMTDIITISITISDLTLNLESDSQYVEVFLFQRVVYVILYPYYFNLIKIDNRHSSDFLQTLTLTVFMCTTLFVISKF